MKKKGTDNDREQSAEKDKGINLPPFDTDALPETGALPEGVTPEMIAYMRGLIETFNTSAARLKDAYAALQVKFEQLTLELEETNRELDALGQMAATMAHKIRNPLGGIAGFAGLLQLELEDNENGKRLVGKIVEGVDKLNRIVSSLLSYTAKLRLKTRKVDLKERMEHILMTVKNERPKETEGISFVVEEPGGPVSAEVDVEHFGEAMGNIIRNSIEAMDTGGTVTVWVFRGEYSFEPPYPIAGEVLSIMKKSSLMLESRQPSAVVIVSDTGTGIEHDVLGKLFVPFFTTKENGNGLGLAAAKKVIEAHHGEIWMTSTEGSGTAVGVILPRTSVV